MVGERPDETIEIRREVLHRAAQKKNLCREDKRKTHDTTVSDIKIYGFDTVVKTVITLMRGSTHANVRVV